MASNCGHVLCDNCRIKTNCAVCQDLIKKLVSYEHDGVIKELKDKTVITRLDRSTCFFCFEDVNNNGGFKIPKSLFFASTV